MIAHPQAKKLTNDAPKTKTNVPPIIMGFMNLLLCNHTYTKEIYCIVKGLSSNSIGSLYQTTIGRDNLAAIQP